MDFIAYFPDASLLLSIVGSVVAVYWLLIFIENLQMPAGPWGLPFFGYKPFLEKDQLKAFSKLAKKYGEAFSVKLGSRLHVIVSSYEMNKEVFVKNSDNFTGIVQQFNVMNYMLKADTTLFQDEGDSWKEQRRFFMSCLRDFGVGRIKTEKNIQDEAEMALHFLRDSNGEPIDFVKCHLLRLMTFNVVSSVTFGRRFDYEDKKLKDFFRHTDELLSLYVDEFTRLDSFPILRFLPHSWTGLDKIVRHKDLTFNFLDELIKEHEEFFDVNNIIDITDMYLKKHIEIKASGHDAEKTIFARDSIKHNIAFLAMAATEDTSVALSWFLKLAAKYPECQKKMQEEMDRVIGRQRLPSWTDKNELPYVEAFLYEAMRVSSFIGMSPPHTNYEEARINGYTFPKRCIVLANFWHIHHDPSIWGDPEVFRPERFIDDDGKINKMKDRVVSFGFGSRSCPGESLARMELFIFITAIIQSFTVRRPPGEEFNFDATTGNQRRLVKCVLCAEPRD